MFLYCSAPHVLSQPMVDFVFGVTHPEHWHSLNIRQNRHHYSSIANLGSGIVAQIQDAFGANVYYNPDININGIVRTVKIAFHVLLRSLEIDVVKTLA
jgi:hypothetical protein